MDALDPTSWLRQQCSDYRFDVGGIFKATSDFSTWPIHAANSEELERHLLLGGHLLPLPKEPAALANVLEVSIVDFLLTRLRRTPGAVVTRGSERGYPDVELSGEAFGGGFHAIDVKAARRADSGRKTQSRITLYTGNTYFKHPELPWPGTLRAFGAYTTHLDILMIYTLTAESSRRAEDMEIIVQPPWRIASRDRSSTTREYIGAVDDLAALREGRGAFDSPEAFYRYWRGYNFKISAQVQRQLSRALAEKQREIDRYRALEAGGGS